MENKNQISFEDWQKLDLKIGKIKKAADIEGADKLYKLEVDFGQQEIRTIVAGIKQHYKKEELKGKLAVFIANLAPIKLKGIESQGMILAAVSGNKEKIVLIQPEEKIEPGTKIS